MEWTREPRASAGPTAPAPKAASAVRTAIRRRAGAGAELTAPAPARVRKLADANAGLPEKIRPDASAPSPCWLSAPARMLAAGDTAWKPEWRARRRGAGTYEVLPAGER